mmetsp:Transcript_19840/g.68173  ORF Transcript_19840/g.68173 Transcript_19840/m.68173 type:complete len:285 (-) Transcript_19840:305-1159(-)
MMLARAWASKESSFFIASKEAAWNNNGASTRAFAKAHEMLASSGASNASIFFTASAAAAAKSLGAGSPSLARPQHARATSCGFIVSAAATTARASEASVASRTRSESLSATHCAFLALRGSMRVKRRLARMRSAACSSASRMTGSTATRRPAKAWTSQAADCASMSASRRTVACSSEASVADRTSRPRRDSAQTTSLSSGASICGAVRCTARSSCSCWPRMLATSFSWSEARPQSDVARAFAVMDGASRTTSGRTSTMQSSGRRSSHLSFANVWTTVATWRPSK